MKRTSLAWENTCMRCGLCCHEKIISGRTVLYDLDTYCEHYDPKTRQCKIYLERLEEEARCKRISRFRAMFASYLPESCGYVQWAKSRHIRFAVRRDIRFFRGDRGSRSDDEDPVLSLNPVTKT